MLLDVEDLRKEYRRGGSGFFAVDGVNLAVDEGDFVVISGRSGSGKSTLLKLIAGLIRPSSGGVSFGGRSIASSSDDEIARLRNAEMGYIPQDRGLLSNFTVMENVILPFYLYRRKGNPCERASRLLERAGIAHLAESYPDQLSGGEKRRASIARSLINEPRLVVADEPTNDLDPSTAGDVIGMLSQISLSGAAVILVTHERNAAARGGRRLTMESGHLSRC
ncbi:MAG: ABC transporter ATP-binding protein [Synergistaceae bacterium]|jgi:putative ABC transport system ATP-binding protein|nr:ABC transporter ATP-binding protein [Synergistaceae bacterium]